MAWGQLVGAAWLLVVPPDVVEPEASGEGESPPAVTESEVAQRVVNPLSLLPSVSLGAWLSPIHHDPDAELDDDDAATLLARAVLPFKTGPLLHYSRVSLPLVLDTVGPGHGLGDIEAFDLLVFVTRWGGWGVGPGVVLPTATDDDTGAGLWVVGPSVGLLATPRSWQIGFFHQTLFALAGTGDARGAWRSYLQPLFNVSLPHGWVVGVSEMPITIDWQRPDLVYLPVGVRVARVFPLGAVALQVNAEAEHNLLYDVVSPAFTFRFGAGLSWLEH